MKTTNSPIRKHLAKSCSGPAAMAISKTKKTKPIIMFKSVRVL